MIVMCLTVLSGCAKEDDTTTTINYYLSTSPRYKFCDGSTMDSAAFTNSLTNKISSLVPKIESKADIIKRTYELAVRAGGYTQYAGVLTIDGDTATITNEKGGWAGESIFNCEWHPFAEKNLKQFPEIKNVVFK